MNFKKTAIAVPQAGNTTLANLDVSNFDYLSIYVKNAGAQAFDVATLTGKFHEDAPDITIASVAGDYTSPDGKYLLKTSGNDPVTLAGAGAAWVLLDVRALVRVKLVVSCGNVAGTTAEVYGTAK